MSRLLLLGIGFAFTLVGCGGDDNNPNNQAVAPPGGAFGNSNLNGTYVMAFSGLDTTYGYGSYFALVGTLTANGSGGFTSGTVDIIDPALGSALQTGYVYTRATASGSYNITADGRGSGTISVAVNGSQQQWGIDFVLTSGTHALITRFDNNGTASGTLDLQRSTVAQSSLQGSYAFGLNGVDSTISNSLNTVGAFALDENGNITQGSQDFSDNGNSTNLQALAVTGSVIAGSPASALLTTSAAGLGTLHLDVWPIDSTHLKLIETDSRAYLEGDAFVSTSQVAFPSGPLVLALTGEDSAEGWFAAGGLLTSDGASRITGGLEDMNDEGDVVQAPSLNGGFTSNGARSVLTLDGIYNGSLTNNALGTGNYTFAAYPYAGGVMLLEIDNGAGSTPGISGGNAYVQTATTLAGSQGYGLNLTGANGHGEADLIAEFTTNESAANGLYDVNNNSGWLLSDASLGGNGSYAVAANGRGTIQFPYLQISENSLIGALNLTFYVVDASTVVCLETDQNQSAAGTFLLQDESSGSTAAESRFTPTLSRGDLLTGSHH
jgi:hypothetical protein